MSSGTRAIVTLWKRELLRFLRAKSRIIGSLGMPFFFLLFLGTGLGSAFSFGSMSYMQFIAPGIIGMVLLFASVFSGVTVIMDRQFGFLKEIMVAPVPRWAIVTGKTLGGMTTAIIQALLILLILPLLGVNLDYGGLGIALLLMALISAGFVALGIAIASKMEDMHGFQIIMNFLIMPMFFLSGALFPLDNLPGWFKGVTMIDPLTYGVDGLRYAFLGTSHFPLWMDFGVLIAFTLLAVGAGSFLFSQRN